MVSPLLLFVASIPGAATFHVPWLNTISPNETLNTNKFALFSVVKNMDEGLKRKQGTVKKNPKPLFVQVK